MVADARFLIAQIALALLGAGAGFHPSVRSMSVASRLAISACAGAVVLTVEATLFSLMRIAWTVPGLSVPLLLLSAACAALWRKKPSTPPRPVLLRTTVAVWSGLACGAALLFLMLSFLSSAATSADFLFFWGVKAVQFANHRGISAEFLRDPFTLHAVPDYPPLVPVVYAWACLAADKMPWRLAPALSGLWVAAAIPVLFDRCRRRASDEGAAALVACWTTAMSISLAYSFSGGNAEAPLLCFESIALVWLLTEGDGPDSRFVPTLALCGAALTKVEGLAAVLLLATGASLREAGASRWRSLLRSLGLIAWPAAAVGVWFLYQWSRSMSVGYHPHGELLRLYPENLAAILKAMLSSVSGGSFWLPWLLALFFLARYASAWRTVAPALVLAGGLILFFLFDYLHDENDPTLRIVWTAPRVTQPALSAAILGAGVLSLTAGRRGNAGVSAP